MAAGNTGKVPVLLLGGEENTLSVARSLGRLGVPVAVSAPADCAALDSRHCQRKLPIPGGAMARHHWERLLLGSRTQLDGHLLLAGSDEALEFLALNHPALVKRYRLDEHEPALRQALLDKQRTLQLARAAGVPTPGFWPLRDVSDLHRVADNVSFPAIIKPLKSHEFQRHFAGRKYLGVDDADDFRRRAVEVLARNVEVMVCELIPGPDHLLSSFYTYLDENGDPLFELTKRVLRRYPINEGGATYHITDWDEETAEMGRRFFAAIGFRGLGNVEFKRDPRDAKLKLIECNARFTAAQELLVRSGMDTAALLYRHLTESSPALGQSYRSNCRMWYPKRDLQAFIQLRARGELSLAEWLRSVAHPAVFPFLSLHDPAPAILRSLRWLRGIPGRLLRTRWRHWPASRPET